MAARVEVLEGPDRGWKFTLVGGEARIGRGAGHQVRLSDPAWPDGDVRVQLRSGGYLVTNGLPYAVYLDGRPLAPGEVRNLHHGATLQPTQSTLLRLEIVAAPPGAAADAGVITEPPQAAARPSALRRYAPSLAAVLLAGAAYVFLAPPAVAGLDVEAANRHKAALAALEAESACGPELRAARLALADGAYAETFSTRAAARARYRDAHAKLAALRAAADKPDPRAKPALTAEQLAKLAAVEEFVNARLRATARR